MPVRQNCVPVQLELSSPMHFKIEPDEMNLAEVEGVDLFSSIPSSDDILDELLDMQGDFSHQPVSDTVEVIEDPLDPFSSVWEQPLSSVGMDFNFDCPLDNNRRVNNNNMGLPF